MRIDVVPTADAVTPDRVRSVTALVVDVLRASTTIITALANGATAVVPVADPDEARRRAGPRMVVAGERGGEKVPGFDAGNSPVDFAQRPIEGRTIVFTTSNGTRALLGVRNASAIGIAALMNVSAAAQWAAARGADVTVVCAGDHGRRSLEDSVCAGLLVERLRGIVPDAQCTPDADEAVQTARPYERSLERLAEDSRWARRLIDAGHGADVRACFVLDTTLLVPVYRPDVDKIVLTPR
ncbi:MAG: 2-phosphosulfolactate phosphatase [Candidatus Rokubacteria bacterium]|nr:2-phosphosulfolactate phosphatase [Candidatus Rokubacteria bacterium]